ncbi:hypothetical protein L9F63_010474 [Diploptera punctata]|uniref:Uncharacterized protein n=1 Tax=Diploptera punctata TaxID=6984 RepID=A0AAD8AHA4_DIPPU|nr:hypothetical protein L9F63_010474 [Diploptera punctata]
MSSEHIVPCDRQQVLKRVPNPIAEDGHEQERCWTVSFVEILRDTRAAAITSRGKRMNIIAGKSVGLRDLLQKESRSKDISDSSISSTSEEEDGDSNYAVCLVCKKTLVKKQEWKGLGPMPDLQSMGTCKMCRISQETIQVW